MLWAMPSFRHSSATLASPRRPSTCSRGLCGRNPTPTGVASRARLERIALQMIQNTVVCAPDNLRDVLRSMTRMQLVRTLAAWRPDLTGYRDLEAAYRIGLKSLACRYLELHDEIDDLDATIGAIGEELGPDLLAGCRRRWIPKSCPSSPDDEEGQPAEERIVRFEDHDPDEDQDQRRRDDDRVEQRQALPGHVHED